MNGALLRLAAALSLLSLGACGSSSAPDAAGKDGGAGNPYAGYVTASYPGTQNWLCHPDLSGSANACLGDLSALVVQADGSSAVEDFSPAADPKVDCFYIYPTTSLDPGPNSDFNPDAQEIQTARMQAARYAGICRLYAPVYRQRTLVNLVLGQVADPLISDEADQAALDKAYADVVDAFREYMAHHNNGRGFILLGHSQGSRMGSRLLAEEIEKTPYAAQRLIAAHLPGFTVEVPDSAEVGGSLASTPACTHESQTGCIIAYSSYREGDPQLSDPRFGLAATPGTHAMCVNPAALSGGSAALQVYLPFILPPAFQAVLIPKGNGPYQNPLTNVTAMLQAPFFSVPGQISGECSTGDNGVRYLKIHIDANPDDPRADNYSGEFLGGTNWGLHLADVNLAQGDLVRLAGTQSAAWLAAHP